MIRNKHIRATKRRFDALVKSRHYLLLMEWPGLDHVPIAQAGHGLDQDALDHLLILAALGFTWRFAERETSLGHARMPESNDIVNEGTIWARVDAKRAEPPVGQAEMLEQISPLAAKFQPAMDAPSEAVTTSILVGAALADILAEAPSQEQI